MKTRILHTKLWKDEYFSTLSTQEKLLFLYFLTNERVNILHCYEISDREILFDIGLTQKALNDTRTKFITDRKMSFFENYVFLSNAYKYEVYKGDLNEKAKDKLLGEMSKGVRKWYEGCLKGVLDPYPQLEENVYPLNTPLKGTRNNKLEIISNKEEGGMQLIAKTLRKKGIRVQS